MNKNYIVAVDLGATNIKIGIIKHNRIIRKMVLPIASYTSRKELLGALISNINQLLIVSRILNTQVLAIAVGLPGIVNFKKKVVSKLTNIKGWHNVFLSKILKDKFGVPVFIDNDANLMALAESRLGAGRFKRNVIGITLGTGVGGGIILDGRLYRGSDSAAGEIGHMPINENGPKCNCGGLACLERYVGNRYILEEAKKAFKKDITLEETSALAKKGNPKAIKLWRDAGLRIGIALSAVVNILNPDVIVLGGGVAAAGDILLDSIRKAVKSRAMPPQSRRVRLLKARLGNDAGMIGAALLAQEELGERIINDFPLTAKSGFRLRRKKRDPARLRR